MVIDGKVYQQLPGNRVNIRTANPTGKIGDGGVVRQFSSPQEIDVFIKSQQQMAEAKRAAASGTRTIEEKKEIVRQSRTTAAGWSVFGGILSTLYFGLRSDKTIADKYNLDVNNDKKLIKKIRNQQTLWTLPGLINGFGILPAGLAWIYNRNMDSSEIDL